MNFKTAGGSVIGTRHLSRGENNQDFFYIEENNDRVIAIVTDGCGSSKHSEIGAKMGAINVVNIVDNYWRKYKNDKNFWKQDGIMWENIHKEIVNNISEAAKGIKVGYADAILDYFLFTIVGFIISDGLTCVFNIGDGVWIENGNINKIGPFPGNSPPFIGYDCLKNNFAFRESLSSHNTDFNIQVLDTKNLDSLLIATDGISDFIKAEKKEIPNKNELVGNISQFWQQKEYFEDEYLIEDRLSRVNCINRKEKGFLSDDTTLVVAKKQ